MRPWGMVFEPGEWDLSRENDMDLSLKAGDGVPRLRLKLQGYDLSLEAWI